MEKPQRKRLLFIIHSSAPSGGAEDDIEYLLKRLRVNGNYIIDGLLPEGPRRSTFVEFLDRWGNLKWGGFPVIYDGIFKYLKYFLKAFIQVYQIKAFIKNHDYDACFISVAVLLWPILYLKFKKFKNIVFIKETIEPKFIRRVIYKLICSSSFYVIPNSKIIEKEFENVTGCKKIRTVYSSVSETGYEISLDHVYDKKFKPHELTALNGNSTKLLLICNLIKIKNPLAAIEAVQLLNANQNDSHQLFIVGKDDVEKKFGKNIKDYIRKQELEKTVHLLGYRDKDEIQYLFRKIDFLVIPSYSEGIPLVLVYALKFRIPVITTSAGGISDVIKHEKNGMIVKPEAESISQAIRRLNENCKLREQIVENGYATYIEKFNLEENLSKIEEVLKVVN